MKRSLFLLGGIIIAVAVFLFVLAYGADMPNSENNGFARKWLANIVSPLHQNKTDEPIYNVCGATATHFFFSGKDPLKLIETDYRLANKKSIQIPLPFNSDMLRGWDVFVDSPAVTLGIRNTATILKYNLGDITYNALQLPVPLFSRITRISPQSFALRAFDSSRQRQLFQKINSISGKLLNKNNIISSDADFGYSTDGILNYDQGSNRLVYLLFYRNQFLCMDSNLNLLYTGKTIDTVQSNHVNVVNASKGEPVSSLKSAHAITTVNADFCFYKDNIFIISGLKSDNETPDSFKNNSAIDVYAIDNGAYKGSFYLPAIDGDKVKHIRIHKNILLALYKDHIATFRLHK